MDARSRLPTTAAFDAESVAPARRLEPLDVRRLSIAMHALLLAAENLYMNLDGRLVRVGRLPCGVDACSATRLIVTSTRLAVGSGLLWLCCARCREMLPLHRVGLRHLADADEVRNQPRCGPCRRDPYRE